MKTPAMNTPSWAARLVAALFACLAMYLAAFVTPQGDIPDESGHYAYVVDMTKGRPLPLLGTAEIHANLWRDIEGVVASHRKNYIVQHPPLYYGVAAIPYAALKRFTDDKRLLPLAPRLVSALSLGFLVLTLFAVLREVGVSEGGALAGASLIGFVPTVTHLASGITNDIFLALLCALATLYLVRFLLHERLRDAYVCALWLTLAGATKMTAWILIVAFVGILLYELRRPWKQWLMHAAGIGLLAMALPLWWMRRNYYHFKDPFFVYGSHFKPKLPDYSLLDYLTQIPFVELMMYHFYGFIGFSGYCQTPTTLERVRTLCQGVRVMRVEGVSYQLFAVAALVCALILVVALLTRSFRQGGVGDAEPSNPASIQSTAAALLSRPAIRVSLSTALAVTGLVVSVYAMVTTAKTDWASTVVPLSAAFLLVWAGVLGVVPSVWGKNAADRILGYGPLLLLLFMALLFQKGQQSMVLTGNAHGIQGRYLLPFVPLLLASFAVATRSWRYQAIFFWCLCAGMAWAFLNAYANVIIPFFQTVRV